MCHQPTPLFDVPTPIYTSSGVMTQPLFKDFCSVGFRKLRTFFFIFILATLYNALANLLSPNKHLSFLMFAMAFFVPIFFASIQNTHTRKYKQTLLASGNDMRMEHLLYSDRIVATTTGVRREFYYSQITEFLETRHFLLLHLGQQLYIAVYKDALNAPVQDVKAFLLENCSQVKRKKFVNCVHDRLIDGLLAILSVLISAATAIVCTLQSLQPVF